MTPETLDALLKSQIGVVLGILISSGLFGLIGKLFAARLIEKMDEQIAASDRQTRAIGHLLLASDIKAFHQRGQDVLDELPANHKK